MNKLILFFISIILFLGCIDPIKFRFSGQVNHVAIQSSFNNKKGGQFVVVAKTSEFGSPYNIFVLNANVYITSLEGEKYQFKHKASGRYFSDVEVVAIAGHTYTLHVEFDGKIYESEPVKLIEEQDLVKIDKLHTKYAERLTYIYGDKGKRVLSGYDILVDFKDPAGIKNFYRWSFYQSYEVETQPENYIDYNCRTCPRPAPKDCCRSCFLEDANDILNSANDYLRDGQNVQNQMTMFIPFFQYLSKKMVLTIYQHGISEKAYNFFKALHNQAESTGSMFDAPPTELKGNISNISNKTEQVIGFFEASLVSQSTITILAADIPYNTYWDFPDDCRVIPNSTTKRPPNW